MARTDKDAIRRAYEMGRLKRALPFGVYPIPLAIISAGVCGHVSLTVGAAILLIGAVVFCAWRGQALESAITPGLIGGFFGFGLPLIAAACDLTSTACIAFCSLGGVIAGALLGARAVRHSTHRMQFLLAGGVIALLTASLGCVAVGAAGLAGLVIGMGVSVPVLLAAKV